MRPHQTRQLVWRLRFWLPTSEHAAHTARSGCTGNSWQAVAPSASGRSSSYDVNWPLACKRKRRGIRTTESNHALPVASNLLNRDFTPGEHNRVWVSDITYIPTRQGWVYLAGIKDLHSREIVGFSLAERMDTGLVLAALMKAVRFHRPPVGLILHSDRGSQYCSAAYQKKLHAYGLICSMSKKGDCYDNAPMESFWGLLKNELVHRKSYRSQAEAITDVTEYIEVFYNRQRRQAALGYLSPAAFVRSGMMKPKLPIAA